MSSPSLGSLLSRLLRPERKDRSTAANKVDVRKRHSAPVPASFDVTNLAHIPPAAAAKTQSKSKRKQIIDTINEDEVYLTNRENIQKNNKNGKQKKTTQNVAMRKAADDQAGGADKENRKKLESARSKKAARRHSTGLAYWFCVSGNADTLERGLKAPFPQGRKNRAEDAISDKHKKKRDLTSVPEKSKPQDKNTPGTPKPVSLAGVIRRDGKKRKGDTKNRHSAPPDTLAVFRPKERPTTPSQYTGCVTHQEETSLRGQLDRMEVAPSPTRSMSPGVRYRVDGTLERPYVFPSALTFGAEGRKIRLRSSSASPVQECPGQLGPNPTTSLVEAEVHDAAGQVKRAETKQVEQRQVYGSNPNIADISYDDFDVRKAFYLKYDGCNTQEPAQSDTNTRTNRNSMPVFPAAFDVMTPSHSGWAGSPHDPPAFGTDDIYQSQSHTVRQRYSMPPKNDEFVYMGSRENLNVWNEFMDKQDAQSSVVSHNENEPRKRYSTPVQNSDYVYMGSIENIQLLNADDKRAGCLSLKRDVDAFFLTGSGAMPSLSGEGIESTMADRYPRTPGSSASDIESQRAREAFAQDIPFQGDEASNQTSLSLYKKNNQLEEHHRSLPELCSPHERRLPRDTQSESNAVEDDVVLSDKDDVAREKPPQTFRRDPFARNLGRASCMPGNKRSFAPPPAIFSQSDSTVQLIGTNETSEKHMSAVERFSIMPGNRRFKLPPPPNYTPPREEMEEVQAKLSECHKGSQTDLHDEALYCVNMEDRDLSLTRDQAKTIHSSISHPEPTCSEAEPGKSGVKVSATDERSQQTEKSSDRIIKHPTKVQRLLKTSTSSSIGSDDVFKDASASDTTWPADMFPPSRKGKYNLAGVRPNYISKALAGSETSRDPLPAAVNVIDTGLNNKTDQGEISRDTRKHEDKKSLKCFENIEMVHAALTSTPKVTRRDKAEVTRRDKAEVTRRDKAEVTRRDKAEVKPEDTSTQANEINRPVPTPRKRYSALGLMNNSASSLSFNEVTNDHTSAVRVASVPNPEQSSKEIKQLENISNQVSALARSPPVPMKRQNIFKSHTSSESCFSSPEDSRRADPDKPSAEFSMKSKLVGSLKTRSEQNVPRAVRSTSSSDNPKDNQQSGHGASEAQSGPCSRRRLERGCRLDDTCIADDEMSCVDDGNTGEEQDLARGQDWRQSMRKCVSMDDLLRSGSILDRSVVIALS